MRALAATSILAILLAGGASAAAPTKIVFASFRGGNGGYDLYVVNPDGSGFARVPGPSASRSDPSWSPSGATIAYVVRAKHASFLYKQRAAGGRPAAFLVSGNPVVGAFPSWSPDGKRIAYAGADGLYVLGGGKARRIWKGRVDARPAWSPDSSRIAFVDRVQTSRYGSDTLIRVVGPDGTGLTTLSGLPILPNRPSWSPDGTLIAFSAPASGGAEQVFVVHPDGTAIKQLTTIAGGAAAPRWSPDGAMLVVTNWNEALGGSGIAVVGADGTGFKLLRAPSKSASYIAPDW